MKLSLICVLTVICCSWAEEKPLPKLPTASTSKVDFASDVWPIFQQHCIKCHHAAKQSGGFSLQTRESVNAGGDTGKVYVPNKSSESRLIHLVAGQDADSKMPPEGPALSAKEIGILRAWIDQGSAWDDTVSKNAASASKSNHWAFQPVKAVPPPVVRQQAWVQNEIDSFVLAKLESQQIQPSPRANDATLFRRVSLDLVGFTPTEQEIAAFQERYGPLAYEHFVDSLLASPHYGEKWARHWLDAARYADSDGYEKDTGRPWAWRFRDWLIDALNNDLPYDKFVTHQLAGDLIPGGSIQHQIATGFHRNTLTNKEGGVDQEEFRVAAVVDRVNTTATVFLGLTMACCQCHDHKYDPVSQREYYQLFAFFNHDVEKDLPAPTSPLLGKLPPPANKKTPNPLAPTLAMGKSRPTHLLIRGDFLRKGVEVVPGTPKILPPAEKQPQTRLDLANWIISKNNPLSRRVLVNWIWSKLFGRGIVATTDDFGLRGEKPSHPELLDYLADYLLRNADSMKKLQRLIVLSSTYQQSSAVRPDLTAIDPDNRLLARQSRVRLPAELLRDNALRSSGLLSQQIGGPSIRPPQPPGISELTYANSARWVESRGAERYQRGLYIWFQRTSPYPMLMTFDSPDGNVCAIKRERSNTPLQALTLLNDRVFVEAAHALARTLTTSDRSVLIPTMFASVLGRSPTAAELTRLDRFYTSAQQMLSSDQTKLTELLEQKTITPESVELGARFLLARVLFNLDEFVTRE
ncbi:MAG: PSD1 and planctomycete cytochrome C domain-containing protein [Zavarzinella sp.]